MENRNTVVTVQQGELRGVIEDNIFGEKFFAFRGIPYARPPLGELRFKDPEPPLAWTGVRDAANFGDVCAQFDVIRHEITGSDDCLYLNIYTTSIEVSSPRPVIVWLHGGGFIIGSGNDDIYGPDYLIRKDVVLVTLNYRLGILGFLNLEDEVAPGNQGLKDQVMALKWIQQNISKFGGDPDNVTICGESAGGASVHYLTLSPLADGLFHKAISQSGVAVNPWASIPREPKRYAFQLVANLGKKTFDPKAIVDFLRTIDAKELIKAQNSLTGKEEERKLMGAFGPGVDFKSANPFFTQHPTLAMCFGVKVPYIIGFNSNEGSFFVKNPNEEIYQMIDSNFETVMHPALLQTMQQEDITVDDMKRLYFGNKKISEETAEKYADFLSDAYFLRGIFDVVNIQAEKGHASTYLYQFKYDREDSLVKKLFGVTLPGATHGEDILYLFHQYHMKRFNVDPPQPGTTQHKVIEYFTQLWSDFARTGNPTPKTTDLISTVWKPLENGNVYNYLSIDEELKMDTIDKAAQRWEWKKLKNKL